MVFDITQLKKIRKQLNLTQHQFAIKAGISQSMVAKIEAGKLDPTYSNIKKIEQALESLTKQEEKEAKDIMIKNIISVNQNEKISNIIKIMNKHSISQLPVLDNEKVIGLVSESSILNKNLKGIKNLTAKGIMEEAPPIIGKNARLEVIKQLLRFYPLILVKERGKLIGLITKADLINSLVS
ncbi:MAG: putative transcription regulator, containing CBS protein [archaeon GW2011_AR20]|nr:MAG: putative transcription regulator, containing CBS protein [archaeon GW2011_AR20]MBS3160718.1 CBS domain-containing protein [Candidatus Woesearchaeota archaeon]